MPCRDFDDYSSRVSDKEYEELRFLRALACGFMSATYGTAAFRTIKWEEEQGILLTEIDDWWSEHCLKDKARKEAERKRKEEADKKAAALSKLTDEEKKLLGLKS